MKELKKYFYVLVCFILIMILVLLFFLNKRMDINNINSAKELLKDLYELEPGNYELKNGKLYNSKELITNKYYLDGNGNINIDKYGNVKFKINVNNKCISKTYLGNIKNKCEDEKIINVELVKNNSVISFILNEKDLEYKISRDDDFKGEWIKDNYKDNLILHYYKSGNNYIWFKDKNGNLSNAIKFNVDCLDTRKAKYNDKSYYCTGSTIMIDDIEWIVIEDSTNNIKLMKYLPISDKLSHCMNSVNDNYCYYTKNNKNQYKWSNSYINYYLNNIYVNKISDSILDKIIIEDICDDIDNYTCDNESCNGYTKDEINYNNWSCSTYTKSKIKIISYDEYNLLYSKSSNKEIIDGNYWAINSYEQDKGSSTQYGYEFYILEDYTNKLDIKPIIMLEK